MNSIGSAPPPPSGDASGQAEAAAEGTAGGSHEALGITLDFPIIRMGLGQVEVGDAEHEGLPALWFGRGGRGLEAPLLAVDRPAREGETLALFTFADERGLKAIEQTCARIRARFFAIRKATAP